MKAYLLIFIAVFYSSLSFSQISSGRSKPVPVQVNKIDPKTPIYSIVWINPEADSKVAEENKFTVKAGILSQEKIKSIKLYVNDKEEQGISLNKTTTDKLSFPQRIDKIVLLNKKNNEIKITVETETGNFISDKRIIQLKGMPEDASDMNASRSSFQNQSATNLQPVEMDEKKDLITERMKEVKNFMLVIANQDYIDNAITDLDHPVEDAKRVMKVITDKYTFDKNNVIFLENPDRGEIIKAFDKLSQLLGSSDNLLIFYAGHGLWDNQLKKGYWLPRNARQKDRTDWFSNSDLRDYIGGINAKHTLLIADACFSGSIFKTRDAFVHGTDANVALELYKMSSRQAMTSGAMKSVPDKSIFIDFLCKRLEENQEMFLGAEQLFGSFKIAVINNSANGQIPQFGVIKESGDEGGDFIFIKR